MLEPQDRRHLFEVLRPPDGYDLDAAVGTTFSLDLFTLLTVPLAFTMFAVEEADGQIKMDPLAVLEALRRYSEKVKIFCQAGRIAVPGAGRKNRELLSYLEDSVVEVTPPTGVGVFHPKTWTLRFVGDDDQPIIYRFICSSRNLTFDRSWDTVLVLEGEYKDRVNAIGRNNHLGEFIRTLPDLAVNRVPRGIGDFIDEFDYDVRRVDFALPEKVDDLEFHPLGLGIVPNNPFNFHYSRLMIVSPFLSSGRLEKLSKDVRECILISKKNYLDLMPPECLEKFSEIYILSDEADPEPEDAVPDGEAEAAAQPADDSLSGLHAKVYVMDCGWDAWIFTGSANATDAGFGANVEFLTALRGKKSLWGIDALLKETDHEAGLKNLLIPYIPSEEEPEDDLKKKLEEIAGTVRTEVSRAGFNACITESGQEQYSIALRARGRKVRLPGEVKRIACRPVTLKDSYSEPVRIADDPAAEFNGLSFEALTSFFIFELEIERDGEKYPDQFVLNLPLHGEPKDRKDRILRSLIKNRDRFIQFILLLLMEGVDDAYGAAMEAHEALTGADSERRSVPSIFLFESILGALEKSPEKLKQVDKLYRDLMQTEEGRSILPEGFEKIWEPIWEVGKGRVRE